MLKFVEGAVWIKVFLYQMTPNCSLGHKFGRFIGVTELVAKFCRLTALDRMDDFWQEGSAQTLIIGQQFESEHMHLHKAFANVRS